MQEAEEAEQRAMQDEEELRQRTLLAVQRRKLNFRSEPSDVLEYACSWSQRTSYAITVLSASIKTQAH